jgi:hypothetical protein
MPPEKPTSPLTIAMSVATLTAAKRLWLRTRGSTSP